MTYLLSIDNTPTFVLATSAGIKSFSAEGQFSFKMELSGPENQEQMAVCSNPRNRQIVYTGARDGRIHVFDIRSGGGTLRLSHNSAINALHALNDSLVLVHGLMTTSIYDLRYAKQPDRIPWNKYTAMYKNPHIPTTPYLGFAVPLKRRSDQYGCGFAYDSELDVVAIASSSAMYKHYITLYSANTGRVLPSSLMEQEFPSPVTCLDFGRLGDGPNSLFMGCQGLIGEWSV